MVDWRIDSIKNTKSEASTAIKREKPLAKVLRDNLTKTLSQKWDFQVVVNAYKEVDSCSILP